MSQKTHLLCTVLLTDESLYATPFYGANISPSQNKVEQFLSMVHSYSCLPLESQDFFVSYSSDYAGMRSLVESRILELFPNARIHQSRLETFHQWQTAVTALSEKLDFVFLASNHDHVYLHETPRPFVEFLDFLSDSGLEIGHLSHWQECLATSQISYSPARQSRGFTYPTTFFIGTAIVARERLSKHFREDFTGGVKFVRPDNPFGNSIAFPDELCGVPVLELLRHLDGYGHAGIRSPRAKPMRVCCKVTADSQVTHTDWIRGTYWELRSGEADLPLSVLSKTSRASRDLTETLLTAISYRARPRTIGGLSRAWTQGTKQRVLLTLRIGLTYRFWASFLAPLLYPIRLLLRPWPNPTLSADRKLSERMLPSERTQPSDL